MRLQRVRIAVVGPGQVGKTNFVAKATDAHHELTEFGPTGGAPLTVVEYITEKDIFETTFVDTCGQEGTRTRVDRALDGVHGAIVFYDAGASGTQAQVLKYTAYLWKYSPGAKIVYARNKIDDKDMSDEADATYATFLAKFWSLRATPHYSISVKDDLALLDTWTAEKEGFKGKRPHKFGAAFHQEATVDCKHGCKGLILALLKMITGNDDLDFIA